MTWTKEVIRAYRELGGSAHYSEVYSWFERNKDDLPESWKAIIRREVETNSSDSKAFNGKTNLFYSVKSIGEGVWGLRSEIGIKSESLVIGHHYTKEEIENIFDTNFGHSIKGITQRKDKNGNPIILLFSTINGPYADHFEGDVFFYDGEGVGKNQELTAANKALKNSNDNKVPVYGFHLKEKNNWRYQGILEVMDCDYIEKKGFMTFEFKLQKTYLENQKEASAETESVLKATSMLEPMLTQEPKTGYIWHKKRDSIFSRKIKSQYNNMCAFCSKRRFTKAGYAEVEAAHIFPKEKDGSDDLRNGIALCKLHHWAFDGGLLTINDELKLIVENTITTDNNYEEIYTLSGKPINLPANKEMTPHLLFIQNHRKIHNINNENSL